MKIDGVPIGDKHPTYVIAEISCSHGGDSEIAKSLMFDAYCAGANAIKIQTYVPEDMTVNSKKEHFKINNGTIWDGEFLWELYEKAHTPYEWYDELKAYADSRNITLFSTPFSEHGVDYLESRNPYAYKIASHESIDDSFVRYVLSKNRPTIISTGMSVFDDLNRLAKIVNKTHNANIAILYCVSSYPTKLTEIDFDMLNYLKSMFKRTATIGLSDHSKFNTIPVLAISKGASIIEKHVGYKDVETPDSGFALTIEEFRDFVKQVRIADLVLSETYESKIEHNKKLGRSIFVTKELKKGDALTKDNVKVIRPGIGIAPHYYNYIMNLNVNQDIEANEPLKWEYLNCESS